jgi:hypothetical protein
MKTLLIALTLALATAGLLVAQDGRQAFNTAVATYQAGNYGEAHDQFANLNREYGPHAVNSFNAGNAAYAAGQLPQAALRYQEALELDPNLEQARKNLQLTQTKAQAMPGSLESGVLLPRVSLDLLVGAATALLWLGLIAAAILFARVLRKRPGKLLPGSVAALCLLAALWLGLVSQRKWAQHRHQQVGVVFTPVPAFTDIAGAGTKLADLKPATSVLVKTLRGDQAYAQLPDGRLAWLEADALQLVPRREDMARK